MSQRMILPALLLALGAPCSDLAAQAPPASAGSSPGLVLGILDSWAVLRPMVALTDTGWVELESVSDFRAIINREVWERQRSQEGLRSTLRWRLLPREGPPRDAVSGHVVYFDDTYFGAWGLLTGETPSAVAPNVRFPILGAVVSPWASVGPVPNLALDAPEVDSINARIAPSTVDHAIEIVGAERHPVDLLQWFVDSP